MDSQFDYSLCESEPLAYSGAIQGVGVLCCVNLKGVVTHVSDNVRMISNDAATSWLGADVDTRLWPREREFLQALLAAGEDQARVLSKARTLDTGIVELTGRNLGTAILLEWLPESPQKPPANLCLPASTTVESAMEQVVSLVDELTASDRVIVYRFEDDRSGTVVAEKNRGCKFPVLGLRYASTDIPEVARQLFLKQGTRFIADAFCDSVPILTLAGKATELDLSFSQLRSVSPFHIAYLKTLGVASSCSVPVVVGGALWGLVTVQSIQPNPLSFSTRRSIEKIVRTFATYLCQRKVDAFRDLQTRNATVIRSALSRLAEDTVCQELVDFFTTHAECDGLAVYRQGCWSTWGMTPEPEILQALLNRLMIEKKRGVLIQDCFAGQAFDLQGYPALLCGLAAAWFRDISSAGDMGCLLFKKEAIMTVGWGSHSLPTASTLGPQASFGRWEEALRGRSLRWPFRTSLSLQLAMDTMVALQHSTLVEQ